MNDFDYRNAILALSQLAHALGRNGVEQQAFINQMHKIELDDLDVTHNRETIKKIIAMFHEWD